MTIVSREVDSTTINNSDYPIITSLPKLRLSADQVQHILVIKLRHFGDVLLTTPVLSTLHANYPNAKISVLVYQDTEMMLAGNQEINLIYTVDRSLKHLGIKKQFLGEKALLERLRINRYDLIVNLSDQWRAGFYCHLLKPRVSLGFFFAKRDNWLWKKFHTQLVPTENQHNQHTVLNMLEILAPLALPITITKVTQSYRQCDIDFIDSLNKSHHLADFILIQPTARWTFKTWSISGFTQVINHLTAQGEHIVLTGGHFPAEKQMIEQIIAGCARPDLIINLAGQLKLPELAVLIDRAKLFIGVDSAPMHMAAALQTPSVVLFGPSNLAHWSPWQAPHTLLWAGNYRSLPEPYQIDTNTSERYLEAIPVAHVIEAVEHQLSNTSLLN